MKKLLSVTLAAALAMTSFAAFAATASAKSGSADKEVYDITFSANGNSQTVENVTLPHTFSCDYNNENGELDLIIRGLYGWDKGYCKAWNNPTVSGSSSVVGGHSGTDQYITVNEAFDGEVTASDVYEVPVTHYDSDLDQWVEVPDYRDYTLTITCSNPKTALSADCESAEDFTSDTETDSSASLWKLSVTPGTEAITSVGVKAKDSNGVWYGSEDTYTTPAISEGTVVFGMIVNRTSDGVYGINAVVNGNDLVMDLAD